MSRTKVAGGKFVLASRFRASGLVMRSETLVWKKSEYCVNLPAHGRRRPVFNTFFSLCPRFHSLPLAIQPQRQKRHVPGHLRPNRCETVTMASPRWVPIHKVQPPVVICRPSSCMFFFFFGNLYRHIESLTSQEIQGRGSFQSLATLRHSVAAPLE